MYILQLHLVLDLWNNFKKTLFFFTTMKYKKGGNLFSFSQVSTVSRPASWTKETRFRGISSSCVLLFIQHFIDREVGTFLIKKSSFLSIGIFPLKTPTSNTHLKLQDLLKCKMVWPSYRQFFHPLIWIILFILHLYLSSPVLQFWLIRRHVRAAIIYSLINIYTKAKIQLS